MSDRANEHEPSCGELEIRPLAQEDDRLQFCSGDIELDRFFQRFAGKSQFRHHIGTTYVTVLGGERIAAFATISAGELTADAASELLKQRLPAYPVPVLRVTRIAVDKRFQGHGIGKLLLRFMLELALELRDRVGCAGAVVDARARTVAFYEKLGFISLTAERGALGDRPEPLPMFLSTGVIKTAMG